MTTLQQHGAGAEARAMLLGGDARALFGGLLALHDADDLRAFASALPQVLGDLIPFDAITVVGAIGRADAPPPLAEHRLAIRTPGGGRTLLGVILARERRFTTWDVALSALLGPHLGAAADHVQLRQLARERTAGPTLGVLTAREREVIAQIAEGRTDRDIAGVLHIEARTVEKHVEHIRTKLGARSRAEAVARWVRAGV